MSKASISVKSDVEGRLSLLHSKLKDPTPLLKAVANVSPNVSESAYNVELPSSGATDRLFKAQNIIKGADYQMDRSKITIPYKNLSEGYKKAVIKATQIELMSKI